MRGRPVAMTYELEQTFRFLLPQDLQTQSRGPFEWQVPRGGRAISQSVLQMIAQRCSRCTLRISFGTFSSLCCRADGTDTSLELRDENVPELVQGSCNATAL